MKTYEAHIKTTEHHHLNNHQPPITNHQPPQPPTIVNGTPLTDLQWLFRATLWATGAADAIQRDLRCDLRCPARDPPEAACFCACAPTIVDYELLVLPTDNIETIWNCNVDAGYHEFEPISGLHFGANSFAGDRSFSSHDL